MKEENNKKIPQFVKVGKDEMNLAEFPITLLSKRHTSDVKTIKFSDTIAGGDNRLVKREWIITGSDEFGLPLVQDNDVWIAILILGKEMGFEKRKIHFSRYELCKIMGWEKGGNKYKRIEDALNRLSGMRIYAKNSFWDNDKKCFVTENFGIIDNYRIFDAPNTDSEQDAFPPSFVNLNEIVYNSIKSGYIKNLDITLYFSLKSAISKRLYRYLDKKRYGKRKFEINLFTLAYTHLGFSRDTYKYASDIKRKLDNAHKEMIKEGFIKSAEYLGTVDGLSEKVVYLFGKFIEPTEDCQNRQLEKCIKEGQRDVLLTGLDEKLLEALIICGVTEMVAKQLLREYPIEQIGNQLKTLPFRKAKDPAAVLVRSIQEDWSPPAGFQTHIKKEKSEMVTREHQQKEDKEKSERREKIEEYIASLSRDELTSLTRDAKELAQEEGRVLFKGKELPQYYVKAYLHGLVEKRLGL